MNITVIEKRFKQVTGLGHLDLSKTPLKKSDFEKQQATVNKEKAKDFGEVFTPLYIVDLMVYMRYKAITSTSKTCDLCARLWTVYNKTDENALQKI